MIRLRLFTVFCSLFLASCFGSQSPAPYTHYGTHGGADSAGAHAVRRGDTLWNISERYRLSMQDVIYVNKLRPPYVLAVGQRLKLPPPTTYKVRPGDSLYTISRTFNVSATQLARQNHLAPPYVIHPGESLRLPSQVTMHKRTTQRIARVSTGASASSAPTPLAKPSGASAVKPETKPAVKKARVAVTKSTPARSSSKFGWPVEGAVISDYGPKKGGLHNDGLNIKAPKGAPVRAAENGVVVYAGRELEGYGNLVLVRHADRWMTAYAHMDRVLIKRGDTLKRGQSLGTVGMTGNVPVSQLHFEVRRGTEALNPQLYLDKKG